MGYRKTAFGSWSFGYRGAVLLCVGIMFSYMTDQATAAPSIQNDLEAPSPSGNQTGPNNPVIIALHKRLGIKPVPLPAPERELLAIEKAALSLSSDKDFFRKKNLPEAANEQKAKKQKRAQSDTDSLKTFYSQTDRQPIWVSKTGILDKARTVIDEFKNADVYGLRPEDFVLPHSVMNLTGKQASTPTPDQLAEFETIISKTVLKYARYAKGGRIDPRRLSRFQDRGPTIPDRKKILMIISKTDKPVSILRALHPKHPQFEALRKALQNLSREKNKSKRRKTAKKPILPPKGPSLRLGMKHAHIVLLRKRLNIKIPAKNENAIKFDKDVLKAVKNFQKSKKLTPDGVVGPSTRRKLAGVRSPKQSFEKLRARLLINMERWRWMPKKMQDDNDIYVWANVPELRVRIIQKGKVVFTERVIAGKPGKQSPMFSDKMEWIEFNPTWFIPNSIKVADILPSLRRKGRVMSRYHLRLDCGKFGTDFSSIDWNKVDIRKCSVTQPTGVKSVLGKLKFKFPNKHSVYMHDTLTPELFNQKHRILSHGCIRVRHPRRMAEILLAHDKGMTSKQVGSLLARHGLHTEYLNRSVPVHITYFSTRVLKDGSLRHFPDYYGHDKRLAQALLGKGHLFKGAIYRGSSRYKRKRKRKPPAQPAHLPTQFYDFYQN
jgi:murein L,D-transpeptidase YcbB/YkuD